LINFGEAYALDPLREAEAEGRNVAYGDFECGSYARSDAGTEKRNRASEIAALQEIMHENPYDDNLELAKAWKEGFVNSCSTYYTQDYNNALSKMGNEDGSRFAKCRSYGVNDGYNEKNPIPEEISDDFHVNGYHYPDKVFENREKYLEGFTRGCSGQYNAGYAEGKKELEEEQKEESDLALAREAGELFGIEEEEVVEFFGGEEGVEQAYRENCVIATASYGSPMAKEVQMLREIRDNQLLQTQSGSAFMSGFNTVYYSFAPTIAQWEQENPAFKQVVKTTITPLITSLSLLNHVSMDSEAEVLGYGISLILLNIGMYFVAPATVVWQVKKRI